ncbi:uncharacterized protein PSFLO_01245 [Pseudozyma flocculosa]|uniref:Uncharacterized protein n=1 Tax=Pseudozyma flocculosa TaxID=84751 RepID=A0A5C3ETU4_9BASI|nr:uncharacterized protein PSFLO_01245 [Pseudozyma flocculosa]
MHGVCEMAGFCSRRCGHSTPASSHHARLRLRLLAVVGEQRRCGCKHCWPGPLNRACPWSILARRAMPRPAQPGAYEGATPWLAALLAACRLLLAPCFAPRQRCVEAAHAPRSGPATGRPRFSVSVRSRLARGLLSPDRASGQASLASSLPADGESTLMPPCLPVASLAAQLKLTLWRGARRALMAQSALARLESLAFVGRCDAMRCSAASLSPRWPRAGSSSPAECRELCVQDKLSADVSGNARRAAIDHARLLDCCNLESPSRAQLARQGAANKQARTQASRQAMVRGVVTHGAPKRRLWMGSRQAERSWARPRRGRDPEPDARMLRLF